MTGPVRSGKHDPAGTVPGDSSIRLLDGLFGGDIEMLAIPRLGEAWEAAERAVSSVLEAEHGLRLSDLLPLDRIQRSGKHGIRTKALAHTLGIPSNRLTYQLAGLQQRPRRVVGRGGHRGGPGQEPRFPLSTGLSPCT
jgi:hypothetical protein